MIPLPVRDAERVREVARHSGPGGHEVAIAEVHFVKARSNVPRIRIARYIPDDGRWQWVDVFPRDLDGVLEPLTKLVAELAKR